MELFSAKDLKYAAKMEKEIIEYVLNKIEKHIKRRK